MDETERLLQEACELIEECFAALGDRDGMRSRVSQELWAWWDERKPKPKRKSRRKAPTSVIRIVNRARGEGDPARVTVYRADR